MRIERRRKEMLRSWFQMQVMNGTILKFLWLPDCISLNVLLPGNWVTLGLWIYLGKICRCLFGTGDIEGPQQMIHATTIKITAGCHFRFSLAKYDGSLFRLSGLSYFHFYPPLMKRDYFCKARSKNLGHCCKTLHSSMAQRSNSISAPSPCII